MYKTLIILLGLMLPINATGSDLGDIMHQLGEQLLVVLPALYSDDDKQLKSGVKSMTSLLHNAGEHIGTDPGTRVNYQVLLEQLQHATQRTNTSMLKSDLRGAFAICASCHNQDKHFVRNYGINKLKGMVEFLAAEYSFMTRDYPSAVTSYRNYLESDPTDLTKIQLALDLQLVIGLEVYADPDLAASNLGALRKNLKRHRRVSEDLDEWITTITRMSHENALHSPYMERDIKTMDRYLTSEWPQIQSLLSWNAQLVYWVAIRGQLNKMLITEPTSKEVPRLLYWLAVSDRALHYRFYDSLSRQYLMQYMRDYTDHPFAKACFEEYEMLMVISFSGSGGIDLPIETQQEIAHFRRLVYH